MSRSLDSLSAELAALSLRARARLDELPPPSSQEEDWRYVALRSLREFQIAALGAGDPAKHALALLGPLADHALLLRDGHFLGGTPPRGVEVHPQADAELIAGWGERLASAERNELWAMAELRSAPALVIDGAVEQPLVLVHLITGGSSGLRLHLRASPGASANCLLLQLHSGRAHCSRAIDVELGAGAQLTIDELEFGVDDDDAIGQSFAHKSVLCERDAHLRWHAASTGGVLLRQFWRGELLGAHSEIEFGAANVIGQRRQVHHLVRMRHRSGEARSRQYFKSVADDDAQSSFDGVIHVDPGADGTDAIQSSNNLQLSPRARMATRPQLDIYADEVTATHGATVGQPDEEELRYLRARGIDPRIARALIIEGFVAEAIARLTLPESRRIAERRLLGPLRR